MDPSQAAQIKPYAPWLIIAGVFVLFILLRVTRRELRARVDEIGYRLIGSRGLFIPVGQRWQTTATESHDSSFTPLFHGYWGPCWGLSSPGNWCPERLSG